MIYKTDYKEFLFNKAVRYSGHGFQVKLEDIHPKLFDWQKMLVKWAARKGRSAIFADTGLGKTFMQVEWARLSGQRTLIIAPLSVARQTVREAAKLNVEVKYTRGDIPDGQILITNYEMIDHFDFNQFGAVVLDESSILKSLDGKTREKLIELCASVPYRLCCTATPAPNDISEIANHSAFLGILTRAEMLAMFFVHDDDGYRIKGHAHDPFFKWLASWGMSVRKPSDIGDYSDDGYILPPLTINPVYVDVEYKPDDQLFFTGLDGIQGRIGARKASIDKRCLKAAQIAGSTDEQMIIWCGLDAEQDMITRLIPDAVSVYGRHSPDEKSQMIEAFQDGKKRVLITKPKIAGFGLNLQNAHRMIFVGLSDSFESYYQCIRRCYRFGQTSPVEVGIVLASVEEVIYNNIIRKEREAIEMSKKLIENVQQFERDEIQTGMSDTWVYETDTVTGRDFKMMLGDSCERLQEIEPDHIDFSVYSPPFMSLYTYSPTERDLGNSMGEEQFFNQYAFIMRELLRITKPGRITAVHVAQVPAMLVRDNYIGLKDFRGKTIQAYIDNGWIFHGEVCIDKDPQAQAIRTKAKSLLFTQLHKDSSWSRPALSDFILLFRKPGENKIPIIPELTNDQWIEWARPIWYGISESDTLQYTTARDPNDERHICPLQLGTIERCISLWTNPGEIVLSPFAGIGSEGHVAIKLGRRFIGIELKKGYFEIAVRNLRKAEEVLAIPSLFDLPFTGD